MNSRQLVFIVSLPRSGSTLLGHFLGAAPGVLYSGEVPAPLQKGRPVQCRYCGDKPCPVWGSVLDSQFVQRCYRSQRRAGRGPLRRAVAKGWGRLLHDYEPPGALFSRLLQQKPAIQVIVDSSKHLSWIDWNRSSPDFDVKYLFLVRDLRGVTASLQRTYSRPVTQIARQSASALRYLQRYVRHLPSQQVLMLQYEQLAKHPESTGSTICDFLGIPFDRRMLEFYRYPSHVMGGNPGPVVQCQTANKQGSDFTSRNTSERQQASDPQHQPAFQPDNRWKQELTTTALADFEKSAGAYNRSLGYE